MDISKQLALIAAVEHENETQYCKHCCRKLRHTKGHKPKKYCSDKCRYDYNNRRRRTRYMED